MDMHIFKSLALSGLILTVPVLAQADVRLGDDYGTTRDQIRASAEAAGMIVREIEPRSEGYEVELRGGGEEIDVVLGPDGRVAEIRRERDDDRDDNDDNSSDRGAEDDHTDDVGDTKDDDGTKDDHDEASENEASENEDSDEGDDENDDDDGDDDD
jgi:hypothetical protein